MILVKSDMASTSHVLACDVSQRSAAESTLAETPASALEILSPKPYETLFDRVWGFIFTLMIIVILIMIMIIIYIFIFIYISLFMFYGLCSKQQEAVSFPSSSRELRTGLAFCRPRATWGVSLGFGGLGFRRSYYYY